MKCPKCDGTMVKGSERTLGEAFACTRRKSDELEKPNVDRVQPYYCKGCGYIEFYKVKMNK